MPEDLNPEIIETIEKAWAEVQKLPDPERELFKIDYEIALDPTRPAFQRYEHAYRFLRRFISLSYQRGSGI